MAINSVSHGSTLLRNTLSFPFSLHLTLRILLEVPNGVPLNASLAPRASPLSHTKQNPLLRSILVTSPYFPNASSMSLRLTNESMFPTNSSFDPSMHASGDFDRSLWRFSISRSRSLSFFSLRTFSFVRTLASFSLCPGFVNVRRELLDRLLSCLITMGDNDLDEDGEEYDDDDDDEIEGDDEKDEYEDVDEPDKDTEGEVIDDDEEVEHEDDFERWWWWWWCR